MEWGGPDIHSEKTGPLGHPRGKGQEHRCCCSLKLDLGNWVMKTGSLEVELGWALEALEMGYLRAWESGAGVRKESLKNWRLEGLGLKY